MTWGHWLGSVHTFIHDSLWRRYVAASCMYKLVNKFLDQSEGITNAESQTHQGQWPAHVTGHRYGNQGQVFLGQQSQSMQPSQGVYWHNTPPPPPHTHTLMDSNSGPCLLYYSKRLLPGHKVNNLQWCILFSRLLRPSVQSWICLVCHLCPFPVARARWGISHHSLTLVIILTCQ